MRTRNPVHQTAKQQHFIDGQDAKAFTLNALWQQISIVPQQPELFHRPIRDNTTLGANISDATRRSRNLEFIETLPDGFETLVRERQCLHLGKGWGEGYINQGVA